MEDVKWLLRKCGFPILIFLFVVIVGTVCWEKLKTEKPQNVAEEVWEPPVEIENSEEVSVEEADTESSMESVYWFVPQSEECLITDEEKKELQSMVLSAAESVSEIYVDIVISDAPNYSSGISDFTGEQRKVVVEHLGSKGLVSVEEDTYMQNSELIENFYSDYLNGQDSMITVFEVEKDGLIGDPDKKFINIFRNTCGNEVRRPQFGMYTGRTPYPGAQPSTEQDRKLEKTLALTGR